MPATYEMPPPLDDEFLAALDDLDKFEQPEKSPNRLMRDLLDSHQTPISPYMLDRLDEGLGVLSPYTGDAAFVQRVKAHPRFIAPEPEPIASRTTLVPAIVAGLWLLLSLGVGASGAALVFHARLAMLLR